MSVVKTTRACFSGGSYNDDEKRDSEHSRVAVAVRRSRATNRARDPGVASFDLVVPFHGCSKYGRR